MRGRLEADTSSQRRTYRYRARHTNNRRETWRTYTQHVSVKSEKSGAGEDVELVFEDHRRGLDSRSVCVVVACDCKAWNLRMKLQLEDNGGMRHGIRSREALLYFEVK